MTQPCIGLFGTCDKLGFGPLKALRQNMNRSFVYLVETELHERLTDPDSRKHSLNARKLVLGHLKELGAPNIYMVDSLDRMLATSLELHRVHTTLRDLRTGTHS
jgi:hypothetical protein